jgi:hypothetical protein
MLDKWFLEDVKKGIDIGQRFVLIDENKSCDFLFEILKKENFEKLFVVNNELDELKTKYEIEKKFKDENIVIFTTIPFTQLRFIREYCETSSYLHIQYLHRYIKDKVRDKIGFDLNFKPDEIIAMGKLSVGKDRDFWSRVEREDLFRKTEVLDFLSSPKKYFANLSKEEKDLFNEYMSQFVPYSLHHKPAQTVANEISKAIFDNLVKKEKQKYLDEIYNVWINSKKHEPTLRKYADKYKLPKDIEIWAISPNHPFSGIDREWLKQVVKNIDNRKWIDEKLPIIKARSNQIVSAFLCIGFWKDIYTLFSYNPSGIENINNLEDAVDYYKSIFSKIDNAVRHLYTEFMAEKSLLKPIQEYYQKLLELYLHKWFKYFKKQYKENQTGLLRRIINENDPPLSIIVGDAISLEIAHEIVSEIKSDYKLQSSYIYGNYPSETQNNMSSLFVSSGEIFKTRKEREKRLKEDTKKEIGFFELDELSVAHEISNYAIFYSSDVDELSEKQNQNALKYYKEFIKNIREKIDILFGCGYKKVYIVSDHGFVLTGIMDEADKVNLEVKEGIKHERYCASKEKLTSLPKNIVSMPKQYKSFTNLYFSKSLNPFKTRGAYGFSHGGITPQELIIPYIKIEKILEHENVLEVEIANKTDLKNVVGDLYQIKLKASLQEDDIFSRERKAIIISIKDKKQFNQSDIINIKADEEITKEFVFGSYDEFDIVVVDAQTKTQLDSCKVKRETARDMGGLGGKK